MASPAGCSCPDFILPGLATGFERSQLLRRNPSSRDQFLFDVAVGIRQFRKLPRDRFRSIDRDPIHLRGRQPRCVSRVINGLGMNHLFFISPGLNRGLCPGLSTQQQAVVENLMFSRLYTGHDSGVVWPGYGGIDWPHRSRDGTFPCKLAQARNGKLRVVRRLCRKAVKTDHNHGAMLVRFCRADQTRQNRPRDQSQRSGQEPRFVPVFQRVSFRFLI
jgi:hypothetical protein